MNTQKEKNEKWMWLFKVAVGIALLMVVTLGMLMHFADGKVALQEFGWMRSDAESVALEAVKGKLVSPATAEFSEVEEARYRDLAWRPGGREDVMPGTYQPKWSDVAGTAVTGQVDSQNKFGAMVRSSFEVLVVDGEVVQCELVER